MDAIDILLTRGVDSIYPSKKALEKVLRSGKKLKLYQGFDPTGTQLHIGHAVAFRKLRQFQELGHHVIFLIGDFTATIGDPTGKTQIRKMLSRKQVLENAKSYKEQASKVLRFDGENAVQILFNADWNSKLNFGDVLDLASQFTVQQMIERDMFQQRLKVNKEISLVEFLYPLMQGYDSVAMDVDLEVGGTDQTFNMLAGRTLMKKMLGKEKFVLSVPLLADAKGTKIGKTEGNVIGITDAPNDLYGKIMALGDSAIANCFTQLTDKPLDEIKNMQKQIKEGANPMEFKKQLAFELVAQFNSATNAAKAQEYFETTFQKRTVSEHTQTFAISDLSTNPISIIDLLIETKSAVSKSQARRLIDQKAVDIDQTLVDLTQTNVTLREGMVLRVGKKKFLKFI